MFVVALCFLFVLFRSLNNVWSDRPPSLALFIFSNELTLSQFFFSFIDQNIFDQYVRFFESVLSLPHLVYN